MYFSVVFLSFVSFLSLVTLGASSGLVPDQVPNPMLYPQLCGREGDTIARSAICDIDLVLSNDEKSLVEGRINLFLEKHKGLAEFGVCLVRKMSNHYISGANGIDEAAKRFGETVHDKWGIGDPIEHNGVLLFLAIEDRIVYISRGSGVQTKLTSPILDQIITDMKAHLRNRDFGLALEVAVVGVEVALTGEEASDLGRGFESDSGQWQNLLYTVLMFCVITAIVLLNTKDNTTTLRRGQDRLQTLMREVSATSGSSLGISGDSEEHTHHFPSASCPVCLEDFPAPREQNPTQGGPEADDAGGESSGRQQQDVRRAMELRCGHQFCYQCLEHYLQSPEGTKCPICRQPVDPQDPLPSNRWARRRHEGTHNESRRGTIDDVGGRGSCGGLLRSSHRPEVMYRLHRLRTLYPDVMTSDTLRAAEAAVNTRQTAAIVQQLRSRSDTVTRIITDRQQAAKARSSGSSGSSKRGFGGGRTSGGRGGSW